MKEEMLIRLKNVISTLDYMASEIKHNMSKYIASNGYIDKYAIKHSVNPDMTVEFYLFNTENNTTAHKVYTYEAFCGLCSDVNVMEMTFTKLTDDLMNAVDKPSSELITIKDSIIIA